MGRAWGRLQHRAEFLRAASQGARKGTPAFLLQVVAQPADSGTSTLPARLRVGFTATRKLGNAVIRSRAKRRLRAAADCVLPALATKAVDMVLIARPDCLSRDFSHITDDLRRAADQALRQLDRPAQHHAQKPRLSDDMKALP